MLAVLIYRVAVVAPAITAARESGTLDLLRISGRNAANLLFGMLCGWAIYPFSLILAQVPVSFLCSALGGLELPGSSEAYFGSFR
ncbi:MAG TPA: hypothetical protein DCR55_13145 [Lentisphaeria bacterium]|nr:hypothetical protein [Lentisphaeria bacterium]